MNEYRFEDLAVGQSESFTYFVTEEKMNMFCELSGDTNPLHADSEFACDHGFEGKVVYGMLTASLISTFGGVYLPGKYCIIQQVDIKFSSPVYVGEKLTVKGTVNSLYASVRRAQIKIEIRNQKGQKVVKAVLDVGFLGE
jgi:3-hydroxybutyryl-CoA dehydratase